MIELQTDLTPQEYHSGKRYYYGEKMNDRHSFIQNGNKIVTKLQSKKVFRCKMRNVKILIFLTTFIIYFAFTSNNDRHFLLMGELFK
jgi:hypothetical protein